MTVMTLDFRSDAGYGSPERVAFGFGSERRRFCSLANVNL